MPEIPVKLDTGYCSNFYTSFVQICALVFVLHALELRHSYTLYKIMHKEISAEIRGCIKTRHKLGLSARAIFNEICSAYGHGTTVYSTATRWIKRFKSGIETADSESGRGRPANVVSSKMTEKVNDLLKIDNSSSS